MHIDLAAPAGRRGWTMRGSALVGFAVAAAMLSSTIVFSEPAPTDALMMAVIFGAPILGVGRVGRFGLMNFGCWLGLVGCGLAVTGLSPTFNSAFQHQIVTLFLAAGALALSGYIAEKPEPRIALVLWCYTGACLLAAVAGIVGYFNALPGAFDLFTNYGRARGTFKDPNVLGAALAPAITFLFWVMLRGSPQRMKIAAVLAVPLVVALLLSFSRGAWFSLVVSALVVGWIAVVRSRRRSDLKRLRMVATVGAIGLVGVLVAVTQIEEVKVLLEQRASLDQSYDYGPEGRFGGQAKARALILDNPFGIGTHTFREVHHREEPHNVYLSQFLNAGWLGGLLYIVSVLMTLLVGLRRSFRNGVLQGPLLVVSAAFAGVVAEGAIIDSDHWRSFFILMGCVWGLVDAGTPTADPSKRRDDVPAA